MNKREFDKYLAELGYTWEQAMDLVKSKAECRPMTEEDKQFFIERNKKHAAEMKARKEAKR